MSRQVGSHTYQTAVLMIHLCCLCSIHAHALIMALQLVHGGRDLHDCSHQHHALHSSTKQPQHGLEDDLSWGIQCSRQRMYIGRRPN